MSPVRFASQVQIIPDHPPSMSRNNDRPVFFRPRQQFRTLFRDLLGVGQPIVIQAPRGHREHAILIREHEREAAQMSIHHGTGEIDPAWHRHPRGYAHGQPQGPMECNEPHRWHQQRQWHQGSVNFQGYHPHLRCQHGRSYWYGYVR
jgi:hypothetical protein